MYKFFKSIKQSAGYSADHFKNEASPKSHNRVGKILKFIFMRKSYVVFMCLMLATFSVSAQMISVVGSKNLIPIKGGNDGKTYAIIIRTDLSKQALVDTTTQFLARYGIVDRNNVKLDEINDETSELIIPVVLRQTIGTAKGMMGIKMTVPPVKVHADLRFEFHDNGGVMIVVQNMRNSIFQLVKKGEKQLAFSFSDKSDPDYAEYEGEVYAVSTTNSFMGKVMIAMNTGLDGYSAFMKKANDYFADINSKNKVYDALVRKSFAKWLTNEEFIQYLENTKYAGKELEVTSCKKALDEGGLLGVGQYRWENQVRDCYDLLFKTIASGILGTIEGVAEDGEQTWISMDGSIVPVDPKWPDKTPPTDPKARAKYLKKHAKNQY
jgi:hypothetical protein